MGGRKNRGETKAVAHFGRARATRRCFRASARMLAPPYFFSLMSITFNAGKVQYDEETKKCVPLPHKGTVTIRPSADEEGFYDFVWAPKLAGIPKDELLIIPGDATFRAVQSCKTGRVFALTFLSSGAKSLYWLQDVGDDEPGQMTPKDKELLASVQALLAPSE